MGGLDLKLRAHEYGGAKSLICITTSARVAALRATVWDYIRFASRSPYYDFVVSLDGKDEATISYCASHGIPLIISQVSEGVGISKNRVLEAYAKYRYYFFIEDDVSLRNSDVFDKHISVSQRYGLHHLSLGPADRFFDRRCTKETEYGPITFFDFGTAQFNFFSRFGIELVGGFHPMFARYRRFGHTEHSYRFVNAGISSAAFCVLENCLDGYIHTHEPRSVTRIAVPTTKSHLFVGEQDLIQQRLTYYPVETISMYCIPLSLDLASVRWSKVRALHKMRFSAEMWVLVSARSLRSWLHSFSAIFRRLLVGR